MVMSMDKSVFLETIGDSIENRILDFLIEGRGITYSKKDVAEGCEISRPTLYKILPKLVKEGVVKIGNTVGRITLYTLNEKSEKAKALLALETILLQKSFEGVKEVVPAVNI